MKAKDVGVIGNECPLCGENRLHYLERWYFDCENCEAVFALDQVEGLDEYCFREVSNENVQYIRSKG